MVCQCDAMCEVGCTIYVTVGSSGVGIADLSIYGSLGNVGCHVVWV